MLRTLSLFAVLQVIFLLATQLARAQVLWAFRYFALPWEIPDVWTQIGLLIGSGAIIIAERRFGSVAKEIENSAAKAEKRLVNIAESLTSRSIADFPDHIDRITKLVEQATSKVMVLTDCVDYGSFRKYESHEKLLNAIRAKGQEGKEIQYLVWNDPQALSRANKYSDDKTRAGDTKEEFVKCIYHFLSKLAQHESDFAKQYATKIEKVRESAEANTSDWSNQKGAPIASLKELQLEFHNRQLEKLNKANVVPIGYKSKEQASSAAGPPPSTEDLEPPSPELFFWIVDGVVAIFSLPYHGEDAIAFETGDQNLIKRLVKIFDWRYIYAQTHGGGPLHSHFVNQPERRT